MVGRTSQFPGHNGRNNKIGCLTFLQFFYFATKKGGFRNSPVLPLFWLWVFLRCNVNFCLAFSVCSCLRVAHGSSSGGPLEPVPLPHGKLIQPSGQSRAHRALFGLWWLCACILPPPSSSSPFSFGVCVPPFFSYPTTLVSLHLLYFFFVFSKLWGFLSFSFYSFLILSFYPLNNFFLSFFFFFSHSWLTPVRFVRAYA